MTAHLHKDLLHTNDIVKITYTDISGAECTRLGRVSSVTKAGLHIIAVKLMDISKSIPLAQNVGKPISMIPWYRISKVLRLQNCD